MRCNVAREKMSSNDEEGEQTVVHRVANSDKIRLRDVLREPIDAMAERMKEQADEFLEELKAELRDILAGAGGAHNREEFVRLQEILLARKDITREALSRANRTQLEILVAARTGIQAFLHPTVSVTHTVMIEVFFQARCRNIACQNQLPGDNCSCEVCSARTGFCNACMCIVCHKFDFDVNTCRWVGCDFCLHWTHTDCAIRDGQICVGPSVRSGGGAGRDDASRCAAAEMILRCKACRSTSELLGWVKDIFKNCAPHWDPDVFMTELDCVRRIYHGSESAKGKRLFWKSEELLQKLKNGTSTEVVCPDMLSFLQGLLRPCPCAGWTMMRLTMHLGLFGGANQDADCCSLCFRMTQNWSLYVITSLCVRGCASSCPLVLVRSPDLKVCVTCCRAGGG